MTRQELAKLVALLKTNGLAQGSAFIICSVVVIALAVPLFPLPDPTEQDLSRALRPPAFIGAGSPEHPLGTDHLGRDVLSRVLWGSRVSIIVGMGAVGLAVLIGVPLGVVGPYLGGRADDVMMRGFDVILCVPTLLAAIAVLSVVGQSLDMVIGVLGVTNSVWFARTVRSRVLSVKAEEYIGAAKAIGANDAWIIVRHVLPNVFAPVLILSTLWFGSMIITESSLGFLGLTKQHVSWGFMVAESKDYFVTSWWTITFPGLGILLTALSANIFGDLLRDVLDPRLVVYGRRAVSAEAGGKVAPLKAAAPLREQQ